MDHVGESGERKGGREEVGVRQQDQRHIETAKRQNLQKLENKQTIRSNTLIQKAMGTTFRTSHALW